jgi:hypothetical protein
MCAFAFGAWNGVRMTFIPSCGIATRHRNTPRGLVRPNSLRADETSSMF